jgi:hypothetical protein
MDRLNRVLWSVIALLLVAAGGAGLAAGSVGVPGAVLDQLHAPAAQVLAAVGLTGLVVALLGALLLRAEVRRPGPPRLPDLQFGRERGRTVVRSGSLGRGLERELGRIPGVERAAARLGAPAKEPRARLRLHVDAATDVEPVRRHVDRALQRLARTAGRSPASVEVLVRLQAGRRRR